jgi:hypothetical protein
MSTVVTVPQVKMDAHRAWARDRRKAVAPGWSILYVQRATAAGGMSYHPVGRFAPEFRDALAAPGADLSTLRFFVERAPDTDQFDYREVDVVACTKVNFAEGLIGVPIVWKGKNGRTERFLGHKKTKTGLVPVAAAADPQPEAAAPAAEPPAELRTPTVPEFDLSKIIPTDADVQPAPEPPADPEGWTSLDPVPEPVTDATIPGTVPPHEPAYTGHEDDGAAPPPVDAPPAPEPQAAAGPISADSPSATFMKVKKKYRVIQAADEPFTGQRYVKVGGKYEPVLD